MLTELVLDVPVAPWRDFGFVIRPHSDHLHTVIAGVRFVFSPAHVTPGEGPVAGITSWAFDDESARRSGDADRRDVATGFDVDGLTTRFAPAPTETVDEGLQATAIDHVVVTTPSLERTCGAIEASLGFPLKRTRDAGGGVRQGFHRVGPVIIEVVERPDLGADEPARLWGVVFTVDDLDDITTRLGPDKIGTPKDAVQPGRRIATVRSGAGLVVPVALMTA